MVSKWYVVQTRTKHENVALVNLANQKFEVFLPIYLEHRLKRGKPIMVTLPLFPSYLFVRFDVEVDRWKAVANTKGVMQLVSAGEDRVSPLPEGFVDELKESAAKRGFLSPLYVEETLIKYSPGDKILVREGIFAGMSGTCKETKKDRVTILLALLSGEVSIDFPLIGLSLMDGKSGSLPTGLQQLSK